MADFTWQVLSFTSLVVLALTTGKANPLVHMYKRVGDSVTLNCSNVIKGYKDCSSTTWNYGRDRSDTLELVRKGEWRQDNLRGSKASRLSLQPDCFLNIRVINVEDAGRYTCRQYDSLNVKHGADEVIDLFVLSGITQKDIFNCSVYGFDGCEGLTLSWSNPETSDELGPLETPGQCVTTLPNAATLNSARCLLSKDGTVETSVDFASKDQRILVHINTTSTGPGGQEPGGLEPSGLIPISLAVAVGTVVLVLIVAVLVLRRKKSTGNMQSPPKCAEDPNMTESTGKGEPTVCPSIGQGDPEGGLTYASIDHLTCSRKARRHSGDDGGSDGDETVTYSTISKPAANVRAH